MRADLLDFDSQDSVDLLDDVRSFLSDGWVFTEQDLREQIGDADPDVLANLDDWRRIFKQARTWRFLVYLPVLILVVIIAFLGGRTWSARVAWAAAYLTISAAAIWITFSPVYTALSGEVIDRARQEAIDSIEPNHDFANTQALIIDKAIDTGAFIIDGFAAAVAANALIVFVIGMLILSAAIVWPRLSEYLVS